MKTYRPRHLDPRPGEIPMKQWRAEMAAKLGIPEGTLNSRLYGINPFTAVKYPPVRRVNQRVVFVITEAAL